MIRASLAALLRRFLQGSKLYRHFITDRISDRGGMENLSAYKQEE